MTKRDALTKAQPLWWLTKDGDRSLIELYERHYSCHHYADGRKRNQCVGPGFVIALRTAPCDAGFVWRDYIDDTEPQQEGVECAFFRNEGPYTSSVLIRQACSIADVVWPDQRRYTKVNPKAVGRDNPGHVSGYCFRRAGWRRCGETKGGLLIFEKTAGRAALANAEKQS